MERKDYYEILGVTKDADGGEIKTAYRKLAFRNHPDTNRDDPRAEDRFKEINESYKVLSDADKRNRYDLGHDPFTGPPVPPSAYEPWSDPFESGSRDQDAEAEGSGGCLDARGGSSGGPKPPLPASAPIGPVSTISTIFP